MGFTSPRMGNGSFPRFVDFLIFASPEGLLIKPTSNPCTSLQLTIFAGMNGEKLSKPGCNHHVHGEPADNSTKVHIPLERINELTPEERLQGFYDVHGVSKIPSESSERVSFLLCQLDMALISLNEPKKAFERAQELDLDYVQALRLRFLRKAAYNPIEAARNMLYHFLLRQQYFGEKDLVGNLTFASFKEEDKSYFRSGIAQFLLERDRSGRAVIAIYGRHICVAPIETIVRTNLIYGDIVTQDEEIQKRGVVCVYIGHRQKEETHFDTEVALNVDQGNPMRIVATHICYDSPSLHPAVNRTAHRLPLQALLRFKCHFGNVSACLRSLRTFGLPVEKLPINTDGTWKLPDDEFSMKLCSIQENISSCTMANPLGNSHCSNIVLKPRDMDIVMGRGKGGVKSLGNQILRVLHNQYRVKYEKGTWQTKVLITKNIFNELVRSGVRFLRKDKVCEYWVVVNEIEAKNSIAHGFRNMRRIESARGKAHSGPHGMGSQICLVHR